MPHAVESAGNSCHRGKKGVAHPDGKHGVFLSEGLPGTDGVIVMPANAFAEMELQEAACQGHEGEPHLKPYVHLAVYDTLDRHGNGKREGYCPEIEGQIAGFQ